MEFVKENQTNVHIVEALRKSLPDSLSKNTEIEIRFGVIMEKSTQKRLAIRALHPCVIERTDTLWFEASLSESDFKSMQKHFKKTFETFETKLIKDTLMKGVRRSETKEINGKPVSVESVLIKKKKMAAIDIFCPANKYDIRIGISEEIVQKDNLDAQTGFSVREKARTTYDHALFVVDATEVHSGRSEKHTNLTYEIEIEAKNTEYEKDRFIGIVNNSIDVVHKVLK
ncbi:polynucleotide 5'-triphosphatase [Nematocida minor]|uniref:polynucleotide 5'-triphosphatase n=1 Tax=Nematocida minor TaxID=1912983 RepID=UPI00221E46D6|nr:polynucleotide 5'-triphosphatase [Nematocida minor]KAI5192949.1 polynucleotide 5'-triphosphatase [Nematocida minor]